MTVEPPFTGPGSRVTLPPAGADLLAGFGDVLHAERDMPVRGAEVVVGHAVVVGELELSLAVLVAASEGHEGEGVLLLGAFGGAQQFHADRLRVEVDGALQVAHPEHRV